MAAGTYQPSEVVYIHSWNRHYFPHPRFFSTQKIEKNPLLDANNFFQAHLGSSPAAMESCEKVFLPNPRRGQANPTDSCVQHKPLTSDEHRQTRRSCTRVKQELTLQIQWLVHQWLLPFLLAYCRMRSFIRMLHLFEVWWLPAGWRWRRDADFDVSESVYLYLVEWKWFLLLKQRRSASVLSQSFFFSSSFAGTWNPLMQPFLFFPFPSPAPFRSSTTWTSCVARKGDTGPQKSNDLCWWSQDPITTLFKHGSSAFLQLFDEKPILYRVGDSKKDGVDGGKESMHMNLSVARWASKVAVSDWLLTQSWKLPCIRSFCFRSQSLSWQTYHDQSSATGPLIQHPLLLLSNMVRMLNGDLHG